MSFITKTYNRHGLHSIDFQAYVTLLLLMPDMGSPLPISMGCACNYLALWSSHEGLSDKSMPLQSCGCSLCPIVCSCR